MKPTNLFTAHRLSVAVGLLLISNAAMAQQDPHAGHHGHAQQAEASTAPATPDPHAGHNMQDMPTTSPQPTHEHHAATPAADVPLTPVPVPTAADRAAAFPDLHPHAMEHAPSTNSYVLIDRLEGWRRDGASGQAWEASAWIGGDINRLWLRSEGERDHGRTADAQVEVLYGRGVSPWWDVVAGIRHDSRPADSRSWAALGVQGLAPYKFEFAATAYAGEGGQIAATVEAEYDVLLTNRWILQPRVEARFSAREQIEYGEGRGLNSVEASLRLRYEITRRFAPYIGVSHGRLFGDTADLHVAAGERTRETHFVAGLRFWF